MNKKMKWIGLFALAASLLLTACGAQPAGTAATATPEATAAATAEPTATPETTATPEATAAAEPAEEPAGIVNMAEEGRKLYAAQITRYAAALSEQWPEGRYFENGMSELASYYYEGDARANVGAFFPDLYGDGSP